MSLEPLDPRNSADVNGVADLHTEHLGDSPVVLLGQGFLRRFFYTTLVEEGLVGCTLCKADGRVVGFISYTKRPHDFIARGVRRHFIRLAWLIGWGLIKRPAGIQGIRLVLAMMRERRGESRGGAPAGVGEVISLVVLPDYQKHVPDPGQGRVTARLFASMVEYFRASAYQRVFLLVKPSNRASNLMCVAMGCEFDKFICAGQVTHRYTYYLNGRSAERDAEALV